jgi:NADH-quinone oxidoreductase subunit J
MDLTFYIAAGVAIVATFMMVTRFNTVHALLYLVVSLLAVALIFFLLGAPLVAALEVIIYAGAIIVLFVFVVMMLNLGPQAAADEKTWLKPSSWIGPGILCLVLASQVVYILVHAGVSHPSNVQIPPEKVGYALFTTYLLGVELASMLLLAGLVGAYHIGRRQEQTGKSEDRASQRSDESLTGKGEDQ